jgi:uncharacterized membrane protein YozB (DUF420 family)
MLPWGERAPQEASVNAPAFSIFSAISEIFVTIGVLYCMVRAARGNGLPKWLMGGVLLFALCVNVVYMAGRASQADKSTELTTGMKIFYATHGTLSLVMFITLAVIYLISLYGESKAKDNWFFRHPKGTWGLVVLWMISVLTGEAIFVMRYIA